MQEGRKDVSKINIFILQPANNLMLLLNFSPDLLFYFVLRKDCTTFHFEMLFFIFKYSYIQIIE